MAYPESNSIWGIRKHLSNQNIVDGGDSGAPTSGTSGTGVNVAGPGSTYIDKTTGNRYIQIGLITSPTWIQINGYPVLQRLFGTISSADITGTAAGQFGHANGYPVISAPGVGAGLQFVGGSIHSIFGVAAYTAGGNITFNWGAGGAALTGLVSAANTLGKVANSSWNFYPLTTAAVAAVMNTSINLVAASAFTNPGTATGVLRWEAWFRVIGSGGFSTFA